MYRRIELIVLEILSNDPKTRNNDKHLICKFLEHENLPTDLKQLNNPISFESITRARRKLQASHPELQAERETRRLRRKLEEDIKSSVKQ